MAEDDLVAFRLCSFLRLTNVLRTKYKPLMLVLKAFVIGILPL